MRGYAPMSPSAYATGSNFQRCTYMSITSTTSDIVQSVRPCTFIYLCLVLHFQTTYHISDVYIDMSDVGRMAQNVNYQIMQFRSFIHAVFVPPSSSISDLVLFIIAHITHLYSFCSSPNSQGSEGCVGLCIAVNIYSP